MTTLVFCKSMLIIAYNIFSSNHGHVHICSVKLHSMVEIGSCHSQSADSGVEPVGSGQTSFIVI